MTHQLPFDPDEYWYWKERLEARAGKNPEELDIPEPVLLAQIPEAIKKTYLFEKLVGKK